MIKNALKKIIKECSEMKEYQKYFVKFLQGYP